MKSVKLEWCLGDLRKSVYLLEEAVKHYADFPKVNAKINIRFFSVYINDI